METTTTNWRIIESNTRPNLDTLTEMELLDVIMEYDGAWYKQTHTHTDMVEKIMLLWLERQQPPLQPVTVREYSTKYPIKKYLPKDNETHYRIKVLFVHKSSVDGKDL